MQRRTKRESGKMGKHQGRERHESRKTKGTSKEKQNARVRNKKRHESGKRKGTSQEKEKARVRKNRSTCQENARESGKIADTSQEKACESGKIHESRKKRARVRRNLQVGRKPGTDMFRPPLFTCERKT